VGELEHEVRGFAESPARAAALTQFERLEGAMQAARTGGMRLTEAFAANATPDDLPQDAESRNAFHRQVRSGGVSLAHEALWLMQEGGTVPPDFLRDLDRAFTEQPLAIEEGVAALEAAALVSPTQAAEMAARTTPGRVAYAALAGVQDPQERQRRVAILSSPQAATFISESDLALNVGGTVAQRDKMGGDAQRMADAVVDSVRVEHKGFFVPAAVYVGTEDQQLADDLFRFRYAERRASGEADRDAAVRSAEKDAAEDFSRTHRFFSVSGQGFVPIPIASIEGAGAGDAAMSAIIDRAGLAVRDARGELALQGSRALVEGGKLYVPLVGRGVTTFVTWEPALEVATIVDPIVQPNLFQDLLDRYGGQARRMVATEPLMRRSDTDVLDPRRAAGIKDLARQRFRRLNQGRDPQTKEEIERLQELTNEAAREHGW
jgi:hypothetical protein